MSVRRMQRTSPHLGETSPLYMPRGAIAVNANVGRVAQPVQVQVDGLGKPSHCAASLGFALARGFDVVRPAAYRRIVHEEAAGAASFQHAAQAVAAALEDLAARRVAARAGE